MNQYEKIAVPEGWTADQDLQEFMTETVEFLGFHEETPIEFCSEIEKYIKVGQLAKDESGATVS